MMAKESGILDVAEVEDDCVIRSNTLLPPGVRGQRRGGGGDSTDDED
jgi:hypothetical protein